MLLLGTEIVALIKGLENRNWFIKENLTSSFMARVGNNFVTVRLEMAYREGAQEIYRIPTIIRDIAEVKLNVWECGCRGRATTVSNLNGGILKPLRLMKDGMAMFSMAENNKFVSVIAIKKNRVVITEHSILKQADPKNVGKFIVIYIKKIIYTGKWTSKTCKSYPKYQDVVEAAMKRSVMKENPPYPLYANTSIFF